MMRIPVIEVTDALVMQHSPIVVPQGVELQYQRVVCLQSSAGCIFITFSRGKPLAGQ